MKFLTSRAFRILLGLVLLLPVIGLAHELLVIISARMIATLANDDSVYALVRQFVDSPVHAKISLETLGGIEPRGLAVAGPAGEYLHSLAPFLFVDPATVSSTAMVSALLSRNSTVLGIFTTQVFVEFTVLVVGVIILRASLRGRSLRDLWRTCAIRDALLVIAGLLMISASACSLFRLTFSPDLAGLSETGIGVGFSLFFQINSQQYNWLMDQGLPVIIPAFVIAIGMGVAWLIGEIVHRFRVHFAHSLQAPKRPISYCARANAGTAAALLPFLCLAALAPGTYGVAKTLFVAEPVQIAMRVDSPGSEPPAIEFATPTIAAETATPRIPPSPTPSFAPTATATPLPTMTATVAPLPTMTVDAVPAVRSTLPVMTVSIPTPSPLPTPTGIPSPTPIKPQQVQVQRNGGRFVLMVDGKPTYVNGLNYNVNYTGHPDQLKRHLHRRDFGIMRSAGVNAVIGWGVYDQATLDIAREYGIGVIMPFELDAKGAFENKNYREQVKSEFLKYVLQYKNSPAVWGWNPGGDELLHRMETELRRTPDKLQAASDFLLELSILAYSADPMHVSLVKEPRNVYVSYIEDSVRRVRQSNPPVDPSRYFVFAVNTYGKPEGVANVLDTTRRSIEDRVGVALVVGEFAPFGLARSERHAQYVQMWNSVRQNSTLGGFAYVFGPDQPNPKSPNPYDPLRLLVSEFSLVDNEGNPVDASLSALSAAWNAESKTQ